MTTKTKAPRPDYLRVLDDAEGTPQMGLPGMPPPIEPKSEQVDGLTEEEQRTWDELLRDAPANVVKELNKGTFETLVRATCIYRDASKKVAQYGAVIKSPSGYPIQSPYVSIMNKQAQLMLRASSELGLTLASRLRVKAGSKKSDPKSNPFAGLKDLGE